MRWLGVILTVTQLSGLVAAARVAGFQPADKANAAPALNPDEPYRARRANPVTYRVDFSAVVTPPYKCKSLKVWMPIPQSDYGQEVTQSEVTTFPAEVTPTLHTEREFGNQFAFVEFKNPHGAQIIRHRFTVTVWELHWDLDPEKVAMISAWPRSFDRYRRGEAQAVAVDQQISDILKSIVPRRTNPVADLSQVMLWVNDNFKYDHVHASLAASSLQALAQRGGHCSDYHGFCAALGRAMGYPTRVTYGINPFPKNSPSHCKLEAYLPPYGWVSFDVSETQKLIELINADASLAESKKTVLAAVARARLLSGFRDNTWFLQTRGSDYELAPPAAKRAAVVRTIYAEADGEALSEPDPANQEQQTFSWMTVHKYTADRSVAYPFQDWRTLERASR